MSTNTLTKKDVDKFFAKFGYDDVIDIDIGYGDYSRSCTVEDMYHMFKARMQIEEESDNVWVKAVKWLRGER